jgi:hypothetical protein
VQNWYTAVQLQARSRQPKQVCHEAESKHFAGQSPDPALRSATTGSQLGRRLGTGNSHKGGTPWQLSWRSRPVLFTVLLNAKSIPQKHGHPRPGHPARPSTPARGCAIDLQDDGCTAASLQHRPRVGNGVAEDQHVPHVAHHVTNFPPNPFRGAGIHPVRLEPAG